MSTWHVRRERETEQVKGQQKLTGRGDAMVFRCALTPLTSACNTNLRIMSILAR